MSYTECAPVYGAKGSTTFLFLENQNDIQTINFDKTWKKGGSLVAELNGSTPYYYGHYETRTGVFKNGTIRLDRTQEWDTGNYSVDFFDKDKNNIGRWAIQLFIIDGVSQPEVKYTCLPNGKIQFNCSVEKGSDPLFQWSLDGNILVGETAFHTIKKNVAVLYHVVSGKLICIAANNASESHSDPISFACEEENINTHSHQFESIETLLGTSVFFQFKSSGFAIGSDIVWKKGESPVAWLQNNGTVCNGDYKNRAEIFANGSLKLDKTRETDSGNYSVDVFTKHGTKIRRRIAKLIIIGHTEFLPVYGAVDSSVFLFMKNNTDLENMSPLEWKKGELLVATFKGSNPTYYGNYKKRAQIFFNGTLRLKLIKTDEGNYSVDFYNKHGINTRRWITKLFLLDVVSVPKVDYFCLSNRKVEFHCSVERGNDPVFQWSLNGKALSGESTSSTVKNHVLVLNHVVSGRIGCTAANNVSTSQSELVSFSCLDIIPFQTVDHVLGSSLLLLLKNIANSSAIEWRKDNRFVAGFKQEAPYYNENYKDRASMLANGTLRLDKTQDTDSGSYNVIVFDKSGKNTQKGIAQIIIIAFTECPQANGSMGSSVVLFLNNEDHIHFSNIEWKKGNSLVAKLKDSAPHYYGDYRNRAEIFSNGTLILHETQGTDTGNYTAEFFDTNGNVRFKWITQLLIVAPPGIETGSMYTAGVIYGIFRHFVTSILVLILFVGALRFVIKKLHLHIGKEKEVPIKPKQDTETQVLSTTES
ncbi:hypothetical protein AOXY_G22070 [Acipenser oxyrinchus oxyrinchus]|uniref:Uncharacterized protein n=1 Tax=Acipenser oxyrinchus oxyrinchus TaxID=40147 RepID=A0AAD8G031_ACIOX|nr:hypothetical protein AOXY_G22070 [Acipenser oxyrinchus oxyrinchus]